MDRAAAAELGRHHGGKETFGLQGLVVFLNKIVAVVPLLSALGERRPDIADNVQAVGQFFYHGLSPLDLLFRESEHGGSAAALKVQDLYLD